jgi:hypothetical protein
LKSTNLTALAVGATAGIALLALLSVLRADSTKRRGIADSDGRNASRLQIDRWDAEGGHLWPDSPDDDDERESGLGHA